jgi:hypothetical protein
MIDPLHGVNRDQWRQCLCFTCEERRKLNRERKQAKRAATREAAGLPPAGPSSPIPTLQALFDRGWTRRNIARSLDMHPDSIRPLREDHTYERHGDRIDLLLEVTLSNDPTQPVWTEQAACKGFPTVWWFHGGKETRRRAEAICAGCPVRVQCRATAIVHQECGMWGGVEHGYDQTRLSA